MLETGESLPGLWAGGWGRGEAGQRPHPGATRAPSNCDHCCKAGRFLRKVLTFHLKAAEAPWSLIQTI